jgi:hypothetical protein
MTDILNDILNATEEKNNPTIVKSETISDAMATRLASEAAKLSADNDGAIAIATQHGEGNSGWGLDAGMSIHALSQDGEEGADISARAVFEAQGLLWDYVQKDIPQALEGFAVSDETPKSKALYRDTDGQYMGTVGAGFNTEMSPAEVADQLDKALRVANEQATQEIRPERVLVFKDGAEHALQTTTGIWETPRGTLTGRMLAGTGYAGSKPFFFNITNVLAVCQNTYLHAQFGATMVRHTKNMAERIELAILSFLRGQQATEQEVRWMERADRVKVSLDQMAKHFAPLLFRSKDVSVDQDMRVTLESGVSIPNQTIVKRELAVHAFEDSENGGEGRSLLDVAQALTYVTSHWDKVATPRSRAGGKPPLSNVEQTLRGAAADSQAHGWNVLAAASFAADIEPEAMGFTGLDFASLEI